MIQFLGHVFLSMNIVPSLYLSGMEPSVRNVNIQIIGIMMNRNANLVPKDIIMMRILTNVSSALMDIYIMKLARNVLFSKQSQLLSNQLIKIKI